MKIRLYTIIFFLFVYSSSVSVVKAQEGETIYEMVEGHKPLSNILEVHYKKDGTIDYYSIGNLLRVTQTVNKEGKSERTVVKTWDNEEGD